MFDLRAELIKRNDTLVDLIVKENGKTVPDANGDVYRGLEVVEHACGLSHINMGEYFNNISTSVDTYSMRYPIGVVGGITPFNFPAMVPLWMFPFAMVCGNSVVLKPTERAPGALMEMMQICKDIGVPKGVVNVVNGGFNLTQAMCENPQISAISFVGGNNAGDYIYENGAKTFKRMQINMGAKNHGVVLPDCDKEDALNAIINATFGAAGQRCMALTTVVLVGEAQAWVSELVDKAKKLKTGPGFEKVDVSPLCYKELQERVVSLIDSAEKDGCDIPIDGRKVQVKGYEGGFYVGPTILNGVKPHMQCYQEEIFGPVCCIVNVDTLDEAIEFINAN